MSPVRQADAIREQDVTRKRHGSARQVRRAPARNADLHGMVPDHSRVALLLLDVVNDLEFPGGERLVRQAVPMARRLARLRERAKRAGIPVIYVNDNYGRWQSDFRRLTVRCRRDGARGKPMVDLLAPADDDYFVLKPKHSGFFSTTLDVLLAYLGARTLVLTGVAGNICVLFTANDAYMRDYRLLVPADCVASETRRENRQALGIMRTLLKADVTPSTRLRLDRLVGRSRATS
jgi:nicotinamidase-related amidase